MTEACVAAGQVHNGARRIDANDALLLRFLRTRLPLLPRRSRRVVVVFRIFVGGGLAGQSEIAICLDGRLAPPFGGFGSGTVLGRHIFSANLLDVAGWLFLHQFDHVLIEWLLLSDLQDFIRAVHRVIFHYEKLRRRFCKFVFEVRNLFPCQTLAFSFGRYRPRAHFSVYEFARTVCHVEAHLSCRQTTVTTITFIVPLLNAVGSTPIVPADKRPPHTPVTALSTREPHSCVSCTATVARCATCETCGVVGVWWGRFVAF